MASESLACSLRAIFFQMARSCKGGEQQRRICNLLQMLTPQSAQPAFPVVNQRSWPGLLAIRVLLGGVGPAEQPCSARVSGDDNPAALEAIQGGGM